MMKLVLDLTPRGEAMNVPWDGQSGRNNISTYILDNFKDLSTERKKSKNTHPFKDCTVNESPLPFTRAIAAEGTLLNEESCVLTSPFDVKP